MLYICFVNYTLGASVSETTNGERLTAIASNDSVRTEQKNSSTESLCKSQKLYLTQRRSR